VERSLADDSLYSLLKKAHEVSSTSSAKIYGVEVAIVTNVQDPEKQGRVKVCFPRLPGKPESSWVRVVQPSAGAGRGFYWLPEVSDEVLVSFERGEAQSPYVLGALWNGKDKPPEGAYNDDNTTRMIQTKSGHQLVFEDKKDGESIVIADKSGKRTMTFDVANKKFLVEAAEGDINLKAEKKIVLDCEDLEIKTSKTGKLDIGSTFDLNLGGNGAIASGSTLNIKGQKVNINPSNSLAAQLAALVFKAAQALTAAAAAAAAESQQGSGSGSGGGAGGAAAAAAPPGGGGGDLSSDASPAAADAAGPAGAAAPAQDAKEDPLADPDRSGTDAAAQTEVEKDTLDIQVVGLDGTPQTNLEVELTLPGEGGKKAGKTGEDGHFKLENISVEGNAKLVIPDVTVSPEAPASVDGRVRYVQDGIDVPIGKSTVVEVPPRVRRCRLRGMHFDTDKTFLNPSALVGIRQLVKVYKSFEGLTALINGHTDKQGAAEYNRGLSEERAKSIKAFLLDDVDTWMSSYGSKSFGKSWGTHEDQQMLTAILDSSGANFLQQPFTDGTMDDATKDAVKRFQHSRLITETGTVSTETRKAIVEAYMKIEGTSLDKGSPVEMHGCGLTHPLPETASDSNPDQPLNRRVEVFLFEGKIDPPAKQPCPSAGCKEYDKWVAQKILDVELDEPPGHLQVQVVTSADANVSGADVHISGPLVADATTNDDGIADFADIVPGNYSVTADKDEVAADARIDVPSGSGPSATDGGPPPEPVKLKLTLKGPLDVFLTLGWTDPDGKEHIFPEGTAVTAVSGTGDKTDLKLEASGLLKFPADRTKKSVSFVMNFKDETQYMAVAPDSDTATKDAIVDETAIKDLIARQFRVFLLPKALDQKFSDWKVDGALKPAFDKLDDAATRLGTADAPLKVSLDPHWQFVRLEFFDRFFGHSDHGHKRVSLPSVLLDGFGVDPGGTGKKDKPDTRCNWLASASDAFKAAQAVPWILAKGADGKGDLKPDAKTLLQLVTDAGSFVVSTTKDDRKLEVIADAARLKPSADRFKLYDLPPLWRSRKWFVRGANAFFDKLTAQQFKDSLTLAKPLIFSLDDLVLCDLNRKQVVVAAGDRLAVFTSKFVALSDGSTSPVGVYKPDTAGKKSYFSNAAVATKGYVTDYPNWTRLVAAQGNLFEAFADRTSDDATNDVVGARAAVRWVDGIATGAAAGTQMPARPARVDKDFFSIQPMYEQLYNQTNLKYTGPNTTTQTVGRFDMTFLRCCDFDGDQEVSLSLHYFRMMYTFNNTPPNPTKFTAPIPADVTNPPQSIMHRRRPTSKPIATTSSTRAARPWSRAGTEPKLEPARAARLPRS
jgi:outer membrane protein OmpA-like peptidoglycan-associated protein/phage baseplate assembly protein gpV